MAENKKKDDRIDLSVSKADRMRQRLQTLLYLVIIFGSIALIVLFANFVLEPLMLYHSAGEFAEEGDYQKALEMYADMDGFLNSEKKMAEIQAQLIEKSVEADDYEAAVIAAESSGELEKYIAERPEIFYNYARSKVESNPSLAKTYVAYVLDYPGAKELYDEACLRNAWALTEMNRYSDVLLNFDEASSKEWLKTLSPASGYEYAMDMAKYSYVRAGQVLDLFKDVSPAAADKSTALESYLVYCGEKTCVSDTSSDNAVNTVNVFDFFTMDDTEYLIVNSGDVKEVYDAMNYAFAKDSDGSYFAIATDESTGTQYTYRFYMLENGALEEKLTVTYADATSDSYTRLWN